MSEVANQFDQRIIEASKLFGVAMVAAAARVSDDILQQALAIKANHSELSDYQHDAYEQEAKKLFINNGIVFDEKSGEFSAILGYLNIKAVDSTFSPTMDAFNQRVLDASAAYRTAVIQGQNPDAFLTTKDKLRSAIVAGRFDTGEASVIILNATRPQSRGLGTSSPG